jgi:hypothetical protein
VAHLLLFFRLNRGLQTVFRGAAGYHGRFSGFAQAHTPYFENCKYIFDKFWFNVLFACPSSHIIGAGFIFVVNHR